jgi:L-fucose isomerase-like protein
MLYSAADVKVRNYRRLNELILEHGFSHHLAMAFGDISRELKILCDYYDIEYISPDHE